MTSRLDACAAALDSLKSRLDAVDKPRIQYDPDIRMWHVLTSDGRSMTGQAFISKKEAEDWLKVGQYGRVDAAEARTDPPVSEAQRRAMRAAAAGKSKIGISKSVGEEFSEADPGGKLPESKKDATPASWRVTFTNGQSKTVQAPTESAAMALAKQQEHGAERGHDVFVRSVTKVDAA